MSAVQRISAVRELKIQQTKRANKRHLTFGSDLIDQTLDSGIESGQISCISGDKGSGKTALAMNLIAHNIIAGTASDATVIDMTGRFYVMKLHQVFIECLQQLDHEVPDLKDKAVRFLDKVKIIRAFDLTGLIEAVVEIKQLKQKLFGNSTDEKDQVTDMPRDEIPDSEDEDDEPLWTPSPQEQQPEIPTDLEVSLLVIDEFNSFRHTASRGVEVQTVLYSFLSALSTMTADYNMVTLLLHSIDFNREFAALGPLHPSDAPRGLYYESFLDAHILLQILNKQNVESAKSNEILVENQASLTVFRVIDSMTNLSNRRLCRFSIDQGTKIIPDG